MAETVWSDRASSSRAYRICSGASAGAHE